MNKSHSGTTFFNMSSKTLLVIVAAVMLLSLGFLTAEKLQDCAEHGGKACPWQCVRFPDRGRGEMACR